MSTGKFTNITYKYRAMLIFICAILLNWSLILLSRTEAQKRADKKYRAKKMHNSTKKQLNVALNVDDFNMIDDFCKSMEISKPSFIAGACRYVIENQIPVSELKNNKNP